MYNTNNIFKSLNHLLKTKHTSVLYVVQITKIYAFKYQNILNYFGLKFSKIIHNLPKAKKWNDEHKAVFSDFRENDLNRS